MIEFSYPSVNPKAEVYAFRMEPEGDVRGVVQLAHGMAERISRYFDFAQYLTNHGYVVVGNDHLGHGETKADKGDYGFFGPFQNKNLLVEDMHQLTVQTKEQFEDVPYFFLGHSMGSFLLREYITLYGTELDGAIIMGTGNPPPTMISLGLGLSRLIAAVKGDSYRSPFIANLVDGSYNNKISDPRTPYDWLTRDCDIVDTYVEDESLGFPFTMNGFEHMFVNILYAVSDRCYERTPRDLPLLLISGQEDPVGGYGKQVTEVTKKYEEAGVVDVTEIQYPEDRHEVLNEENKDEVYRDILTWLDQHASARAH